jgi:AraC family transcriptional regulator, regulatory protein of adaptative response / methylated-DNA-[protein]-cysteine methyltransferase
MLSRMMEALTTSSKPTPPPLPRSLGPEEFWKAVIARDRRFRQLFVYGVRSTGIYCRSTCPSRRPNREQVAFFAGPEAAEFAGFRACRRCDPKNMSLRDERAVMVQRVCREIDAHLDEPVRLERLGQLEGLSPAHLQRTFKHVLGISPLQYARARRVLMLKGNLKRGEDVTSAMYSAGFGSSSRLYEHTSSALGMTPSTYRSGGAGTTIRYSVVTCSLGRVLVAATERGVCAVRFGESSRELVTELRREFGFATVHEELTGISDLVRRVVACVDGHAIDPDIPLDIRGTAFQAKVWETLRKIPRGETRTYAAIASEIRKPSAVRAVANACASNPVAVLVPCHRIVRTDGSMGGYRWGMERKTKLLQREQSPVAGRQ